MGFMFRRVFWGCVFIFLGLGIFIEHIYGISLPLWDIFWSVVIIGIGISILFPRHHRFEDWREEIHQKAKDGEIIFDEATIEGNEKLRQYKVIFSNGQVDLTNLTMPKKNQDLKIDTVFGKAVIKINKEFPVQIKATSVFGDAKLPDGNSASFGDTYYKSSSFDPKKPHYSIRVDVVFGDVDIIEV